MSQENDLLKTQRDALLDGRKRQVAAQDATTAADVKHDADTQKTVLAAALLGANNGGQQNEVVQALLLELLGSIRSDKADKAKAHDTFMAERNAMHLAQVENLKNSKAQTERNQKWCNHRKDNGKSVVGGQQLYNGHMALLCGHCYKEFDENTCPPDLMPRGEECGLVA